MARNKADYISVAQALMSRAQASRKSHSKTLATSASRAFPCKVSTPRISARTALFDSSLWIRGWASALRILAEITVAQDGHSGMSMLTGLMGQRNGAGKGMHIIVASRWVWDIINWMLLVVPRPQWEDGCSAAIFHTLDCHWSWRLSLEWDSPSAVCFLHGDWLDLLGLFLDLYHYQEFVAHAIGLKTNGVICSVSWNHSQ